MNETVDPRPRLIAIGRLFYERGWMRATAGNLSARADDQSFWVTASGLCKGELNTDDFLRIALADGRVLEGGGDRKPSAETAIHRAIYNTQGSAAACLHGHSVEAVLASRGRDPVVLPRVEMIKALGVWDDGTPTALPVFANHPDVASIGQAVETFLRDHPRPLPALIVRDHGVTAWGQTISEALRHFEAVEFLLTLLARGF
ncbi:methylthioribulose 1-phosphate dehydratase [Acidiferrobacter thiooxydans]|nr:methylthioribulose 1-phosphate dehydratase [Acidiferrobacter thiooxydans]MDA8190307.1 methylthioribulose 1-phosphate dehydratase [Gammaproteobacteria bacterium]UEN99886.1 methylthioribulose 1-phosphate dehydratase [Acidiferrobacter thiooxydans]